MRIFYLYILLTFNLNIQAQDLRNTKIDGYRGIWFELTRDLGNTWLSVSGDSLEIPVDEIVSNARVKDYFSENKNVYMKDMGYDASGNPVCLHIISNGHEPGPASAPYQ